ncbi:MAG: formylglycine-generating enzyme family protein [Phycisphaerae bacterium]|nr:formylglycine-generating enzyme family protein [Phycisphaerae bacterium]
MKKISLVGFAVLCCIVCCLAADRKERPAARARAGDAPSASPPQSKVPSWAKVSKAQLAEAKKLGVPVAFANAAGVKFVLVPPGQFMMGSAVDEPGHYKEEAPQHKVTVRRAFYTAIHQVTHAQWQAVMGTTPWKGKPHCKDGPDYAVNHVNWNDATAFCAKLGAKDGRAYRLPTEAQWEYACRAGTTTRYFYGDDPKAEKLTHHAVYFGNTWDKPETRHVHKVGTKKPNAWGIHDMHGNVWELCMDMQHKNFEGAPSDDRAWMDGGEKRADGTPGRVLRGGGFRSTDRRCRSASRYSYPQTAGSYYVGFRIACDVGAKAP